MREAGITGAIVPWEDVLHEGPVPEGLGSPRMLDRRAEFLAGCGWAPFETIRRSLADVTPRSSRRPGARRASPPGTMVDEIVLWLEHDLYDQLHRLQILDRVPLDGTPRITAVPDDDYLGLQPPGRFRELFGRRREVTSAERIAARDGWTAFRVDRSVARARGAAARDRAASPRSGLSPASRAVPIRRERPVAHGAAGAGGRLTRASRWSAMCSSSRISSAKRRFSWATRRSSPTSGRCCVRAAADRDRARRTRPSSRRSRRAHRRRPRGARAARRSRAAVRHRSLARRRAARRHRVRCGAGTRSGSGFVFCSRCR